MDEPVDEQIDSTRVEEIQVPTTLKDPLIWSRLGQLQFWYSIIGLVMGLAVVAAGVILIKSGIEGHVSWTSKVLGIDNKISDAPPGVILVLAGFLVVYVTRFSVKR